MTPLDLTEAPPRPPQTELRGLCMVPRMIDIVRAMLPGGSVGEYQIGRGVSGAVLSAFGISAAEFVRIVGEAPATTIRREWSPREAVRHRRSPTGEHGDMRISA